MKKLAKARKQKNKYKIRTSEPYVSTLQSTPTQETGHSRRRLFLKYVNVMECLLIINCHLEWTYHLTAHSAYTNEWRYLIVSNKSVQQTNVGRLNFNHFVVFWWIWMMKTWWIMIETRRIILGETIIVNWPVKTVRLFLIFSIDSEFFIKQPANECSCNSVFQSITVSSSIWSHRYSRNVFFLRFWKTS